MCFFFDGGFQGVEFFSAGSQLRACCYLPTCFAESTVFGGVLDFCGQPLELDVILD